MIKSRIAYIAFDIVPAPKGAAIHIAAFSVALAAAFGEMELVTVSPTAEPIEAKELYPQVIQTALPAIGNNLIERILYFRQLLQQWLQGRRFEVIHIRSIYEGFGIALNKEKYCDRLIFEVNGLPSIELKYRYPAVAEDWELLHKLHSQEQICLTAADLIVTPSAVTKEYLQNRGISAKKIQVIPNGVDLDVFTSCLDITDVNNNSCRVGILPASDKILQKCQHIQKNLSPNLSPARGEALKPPFPRREGGLGGLGLKYCDIQVLNMIYFGTLSPWQGVNLAVEALGLINRDFPAHLTVIGQARDYQIKALNQLASKLGIADKLTILEPISQTKLVEHIHASDVILAPLTGNDRNLVQGCCPLKILEGMATGIPIIASDLPVVRELGENGVHFLLVKSGSAKSIKDAVLQLRNQPELAIQLAINARQRIEENYTWKHAGEALTAAYSELGIKRSMRV